MKTFLAGISIAVIIGVAAPARANDATDQLFLHGLYEAGIEYADPQEAIEAGKAICGYIQEGNSMDQTVRAVKNANPNLSLTKAAQFVAIARSAYCGGPPGSQ